MCLELCFMCLNQLANLTHTSVMVITEKPLLISLVMLLVLTATLHDAAAVCREWGALLKDTAAGEFGRYLIASVTLDRAEIVLITVLCVVCRICHPPEGIYTARVVERWHVTCAGMLVPWALGSCKKGTLKGELQVRLFPWVICWRVWGTCGFQWLRWCLELSAVNCVISGWAMLPPF